MESNAAAHPAPELHVPELDAQLDWSPWSRLQTSFSLALTPSEPGVFALAEEVLGEGESALVAHRRMLALFQISPADDLAHALGRLFASPLRERLQAGRCFVRYALIRDRQRRDAVGAALQNWLAASSEAAAGIAGFTGPAVSLPHDVAPEHRPPRELGPPPPLPSGF